MAGAGVAALKIDVANTERPSANKAGVDALMREFFQRNLSENAVIREAPSDAEPKQSTSPRRDFDMSAELLDRAAKAFDVLMDRCQTLERDLGEANERARAQASEQADTIERWKRLASGLKAQAESAERDISALKARCDKAEERAGAAEHRTGALERASAEVAGRATAAEQLSTRLHDKVISAFGIGSRAHPVLEAVATRAAAE